MKVVKNVLLLIVMIYSVSPLSSQEWMTDIAEAQSIAKDDSRTILLVFQGSDWCGPCIKMEKSIWDTEVFKKFAEEKLVLLKADFPRRKKNALPKEIQESNALLADQYNSKGLFPYVALLDSEGNKIGETGFKNMKAQDYIDHLNSILKL